MEEMRKIPTLLEMCLRTAIDNLRYIRDVGEVDLYLLKDILPHCTVDQLMNIEKSTLGRDLSPVTDLLWKRFYEKEFGVKNANEVIEKMRKKNVQFKWRQLYEAKSKVQQEFQSKCVERFRKRFAEVGAQKQSRQIQICSKVPPASNKRSFWGGSGPSYHLSGKPNLMKKAKLEFLKSPEATQARAHAIMKKLLYREQPHILKVSRGL